MSEQQEVCPQEPDKPYEQTVCGMAKKVSKQMCDRLDDGTGKVKTVCEFVINKVGTGDIKGEDGRMILIMLVGKDKFDEVAQEAINIIESS